MYKYLEEVKRYLCLFSQTRDPISWKKFYEPKLLKFFKEFLSTKEVCDTPFYKIDNVEITAFLNTFDNKPILKLNYYSALNAFYRFTYDNRYSSDVMKEVERPAAPQIVPPKYIKDAHIDKIKEFINDEDNSINDRLLLAFFLYTGLSRLYIYSMCNRQLSKSNNGKYYLWIEDVGAERQLPLCNIMQTLIVKYKELDGTDIPHSKVFNYNETYISTKIKSLSKLITNSYYTPQVYGNTFIKLALKCSNDVYSVSRLTLKSLIAIEKHIQEPLKLIIKQQDVVNSI